MTHILLATCAELPAGGEESVLPDLFAARGVEAVWAQWDDPDVDWSHADLVAIRTTWDYTERLDAFLAWTRRVGRETRLINAPEVIEWNTDKRYLLEVSQWGLPIVPTSVVADDTALTAALSSYDQAIIKPTVGVGGVGLYVWRGGATPPLVGPVVVQPLVESIFTHGEVSVFVMGGEAVAQVVKRPGGEEVRVHEEYGGIFVVEELDPSAATLASAAVDRVAAHFDSIVAYGRVDLLWFDGRWVVSELELTEPGLYVAVTPAIAGAYVDAVVNCLAASETGVTSRFGSDADKRV